MNGVPSSWDANGNLLSDSINTYTYDHANRLIGVSDGQDSYAFAYNGLGDRLQQTTPGGTTNYTLDLNAGLTQVLADGTNTFLYGLGRIGQQGADWAYHLPDALGSVRQLADPTGAVISAQSYEPYGESLGAFGSPASSYGFAGEWTDGTGVMYLRARYYNPVIGAFFQVDPFEGIETDPRSSHQYQYAFDNPILYTDPSGRIAILCGSSRIVPVTGGTCYLEIPLLFGPSIKIPLPCPKGSPRTIESTPTPAAATATPKPSNDALHAIKVYKGLKGTSPSEFTNFDNPNQAKGEPGGYSAYEVLVAPYKFQLPFIITYRGDKVPGVRGNVVGLELGGGKTYFNEGVAIYTPHLMVPAIGFGHCSIFVIGRTITAEELTKLKEALSEYAKDFAKTLK